MMQQLQSEKIGRYVFADGGVGAAAGFDGDDAGGGKGVMAG